MIMPNTNRLLKVMNLTWPAFNEKQHLGWNIQEGAGGGKRVSSAKIAQLDLPDIEAAEYAMHQLGQNKLFMIRDGDHDLDKALEALNYRVIDPSSIYVSETAQLAPETLPLAQSYAVWEPLQVMHEIWSAGNIGKNRVSVMHRVHGDKTGLLARDGDTAAGTAFIALDDEIAMVHAVEVLKSCRRKGVARKLMAQAAKWAKARGATYMSLITTNRNVAANSLYQSMGMLPIAKYHYRIKES
jgi:GNAT superfamily N-acetyltransferase